MPSQASVTSAKAGALLNAPLSEEKKRLKKNEEKRALLNAGCVCLLLPYAYAFAYICDLGKCRFFFFSTLRFWLCNRQCGILKPLNPKPLNPKP
jgi:hypothetical protein